MKRSLKALSVAVFVVVLGCVIIPDTFEAHIFIDIRHVQEQASDVLDYVEGKTDVVPELDAAVPQSTSYLKRTVEFLAPMRVAYAAELDEGSPRAKQILKKMKKRYPEVQAIKKKGYAGETNRGLLELVEAKFSGSEEDMNAIQQLIAADNQDRKALYQEIARINKEQMLRVAAVERVYAQKRLERAQPGELFQLSRAGEEFDAFKKSEMGQKLGYACVPEAWVTIR